LHNGACDLDDDVEGLSLFLEIRAKSPQKTHFGDDDDDDDDDVKKI
jgi:hypothetical protein